MENGGNNIITETQAIVDWLLSHESMTPKKLQKMLYYSYAWVLTLSNEDINDLKIRLFDDEFEAWVHGPVCHSVYSKYKEYGYKEIEKVDKRPKLPSDIEAILNQVIDVYGEYDAYDLEGITHQEDPWINARKGLSPAESGNRVITDKEIFGYYIQRAG